MPAKSGASHALASFITIILGTLISNYLNAHSNLLWGITRSVGGVVIGVTGLSLPEVVTGIAVVSTVLSFLWGVAYHISRHGLNSGNWKSTRPGHRK